MEEENQREVVKDSDEEKESEDSESEQEGNEMRIDNNPDKKFDVSEVKEKVAKNPWIVISVVLGIVVVVLLFMVFRGGITGGVIGVSDNVVSGESVGEKIVDYLNGKVGGGVSYISIDDIGDLYKIIVLYQGQEIPVFITKDGEYFVQGAVLMSEDVAQQQLKQQRQGQEQPSQQQEPPVIMESSEEDLVV